MAVHPEYAEYRKQVPMIVPGLPKRVEIISSSAIHAPMTPTPSDL